MRSSSIVRKRGKASKVHTSRRIREFVIKSVQSSGNFPEDAYMKYFQNLPEENFPELNMQSLTSVEDTPMILDGNHIWISTISYRKQKEIPFENISTDYLLQKRLEKDDLVVEIKQFTLHNEINAIHRSAALVYDELKIFGVIMPLNSNSGKILKTKTS
ncbi:hypothetical protein FQA39_LY05042 [Lamprigera yunnana]|nr:hypothetical protein FQA39_LY05042 [Lamprigera yunnana]